jgi:hypothetical protein
MVEMADMDVRIEAQLNLPGDVFQFGFAGIVQVIKEHEGARDVVDWLVFDGRQDALA